MRCYRISIPKHNRFVMSYSKRSRTASSLSRDVIYFQKYEPTFFNSACSVKHSVSVKKQKQPEPRMSQKKKACRLHFLGLAGLSAFQHFVELALELCHRTVAWMYFLPCFSCYFFVAGLFRLFFFFFLWSNYRQCRLGSGEELSSWQLKTIVEQKQAWLLRSVLAISLFQAPAIH